MAEGKEGRQTYTTNVYKTEVDNVSFLGNPHIDNIATTLIAMGNEIWTNRRRLYVMESLMKDKGVTTEMIEQYMPTEEEKTAWAAEREVMVERLWAHFARVDQFDFADDWDDSWGRGEGS